MITDFAVGADRLRFEGIPSGAVSWAVQEGGTLVQYGAGDQVLLAGILAGFGAADLVFA